ncbi:MAG: MarR family transcriptional regulator [Clostridiales bacterium]|jgi:DNA-binding MarR family transcriptional regulator|nr:MarR family transcriptional regulator [Clostridiales bacterium]
MTTDFEEIYRYLRLAHYRNLFSMIREKPGSLSATEAFSVEVIYLLGEPTLGEFAEFIGISQPNASYKVNTLVTKGYITKESCESDKRECRLVVTKKFRDYYGSQIPDISQITKELSEEEKNVLDKLEQRVAKKLSAIIKAGGKS